MRQQARRPEVVEVNSDTSSSPQESREKKRTTSGYIERKLLEWANSRPQHVGISSFRNKAAELNRGQPVCKPWLEKIYRKINPNA